MRGGGAGAGGGKRKIEGGGGGREGGRGAVAGRRSPVSDPEGEGDAGRRFPLRTPGRREAAGGGIYSGAGGAQRGQAPIYWLPAVCQCKQPLITPAAGFMLPHALAPSIILLPRLPPTTTLTPLPRCATVIRVHQCAPLPAPPSLFWITPARIIFICRCAHALHMSCTTKLDHCIYHRSLQHH